MIYSNTELIDKTYKVVQDMFKGTNTVISRGTKHPLSSVLTILRDGRDEYNPAEHRRDCFDMMLHYNLYIIKDSDGMYIAGEHNSPIKQKATRPTVALLLAAYDVISKVGD